LSQWREQLTTGYKSDFAKKAAFLAAFFYCSRCYMLIFNLFPGLQYGAWYCDQHAVVAGWREPGSGTQPYSVGDQ
jgi:hypothetical protein